MYCKNCGAEIGANDSFCRFCGHPVNAGFPGFIPSFFAGRECFRMSREWYVFSAVASALTGLAMISGGVYGIIFLTAYTLWVIPGSVCVFLGGLLCLAHTVGVIRNKKSGKE